MEVLSPVKNLEGAKVAIRSGANAIYFSSNVLGAREGAKNSHDEVIEIVEYAKLHYIKTYVTLNTIILNSEIDTVIDEINFLHSVGVDAIILQDYAYIEVIKSMFSDLEIHCSTQMNIDNSKAAEFVLKLGANRTIIPRETSIDQIKPFIKTGIETEVFVHGALCTSYSGLCLISSFNSRMSGNRGKCSQFCRMDTTLYKNNEEVETDDYILSFKDLNVSENINQLIDLGVTSCKIEGRLKQSEYVAITTSVYRNLVDNKSCDVDNLKKVYNREFTKGFVSNSKSNNINNSTRINNSGFYVGKVIKEVNSWIYIEAVEDLYHLDKIRFIHGDFETGQTIDVIETVSDKVFRIKTRIEDLVGAQVYVVESARIKSDVKQGLHDAYKKPKYKIEVNMNVGSKIEIVCEDKSYYSASILEEAKTKALEEKDILKQLNKTKDYGFDFEINLNYAPGFIRVSELNEIRRNIYEDIKNNVLHVDHKDKSYEYSSIKEEQSSKTIYIEVNSANQLQDVPETDETVIVISDDSLLEAAKSKFKTVYKVFPSVVEDEYLENYLKLDGYDGSVVSELGGLEMLSKYDKPIITNYSLNTTNIINQQMMLKYCNKTMLSLELSYDELDLFNHAKSVGFLYGHPNVMQMKYCPLNQAKQDKCGNCTLCTDNNYEIDINRNTYQLFKQDYDKLALLSSKPIYNPRLLDCNMDYYIRFTKEENVGELMQEIFDNSLEDFHESYLEKVK